MMVSHDDGSSWESLRLNMPTVAIADIAVAGDDLVIGTLGRAAYILDDLTPVRDMSDELAAEVAHIFPPQPAIRWTYASAPDGSRDGATSNPPKGLSITYNLASEPEDDITLDILDSNGHVIRSFSSEAEEPHLAPDHPDARPDQKSEPDLTKNKGLNRASWDLAYEGAKRIPDATNDAGNVNVAPLAAPGDYVLRLSVDGQQFAQTATVIADPRSDATVDNIRLQIAFLLDVRDVLTAISDDAVNIRALREQLDAHQARLKDDPRAERLVALGEEASEKLHEIELALYNPNAVVNYDILGGRDGGAKLYSRLGWLYRTSLGHNGPPTQGQQEVGKELTELYEASKAELGRIQTEDLAQLNSLAGEIGVEYVVN